MYFFLNKLPKNVHSFLFLEMIAPLAKFKVENTPEEHKNFPK